MAEMFTVKVESMEMENGRPSEVVNMTRAIEALYPLLNHPRRIITKVEALVLATIGLLFLQLILGFCKRKWHNSFVKYVLSASNAVILPLIVYTLGVMQSSPVKNSVYPVWAVSLIMASGGTIIIKQYDFHDNKKIMTFTFEIARYGFYFFMFSMLLSPYSSKDRLRSLNATWTIKNWRYLSRYTGNASSLCLSVLFSFVYGTKFVAGLLTLALKEFDNGRLAAMWMNRHVSNDHLSESEPKSMKGYNYLVRHRVASHRFFGSIATLDKIWECLGSSDGHKTLKDICLSFALFELLKRRCYGWVCAEANLSKTKDFVFKGLLQHENDYRRAFRIVEEELGFCYDFFFTKYHLIHVAVVTPLFTISLCVVFLLKIILISLAGMYALKNSFILETPDPIIEVQSTRTDYIITLVVLGTILTVELLQAVTFVASYWFVVSLACRSIKHDLSEANAYFGKVAGFLSRVASKTNSAGWKNKIGQYSVIHDCSYNSYIRRKLEDHNISFFVLSIIQSKVPCLENKLKPVKVSDTMKRAIARSLISTAGNLTNGEKSLMQNQVFDKYSWTLRDHSQIEIMLIWHIATEYCKLAQSGDRRNGTDADDRDLAVKLSRYCAYLIAYVPELLPYHVADLRYLRSTVLKEGDSCNSLEQMRALEETDEEANPATVYRKGVKLGKQLDSMTGRTHCWKVMADFWCEAFIYVAPSHFTAKQHMRHLEKGGEFLTHLWALLSHAGILNLDRSKDQGRTLV